MLGEEIDRQSIDRENADGSVHRVERQVFLDRTKTIINRVSPTSDVPFDWTLNPYRGCEHGCIYCFATPYHEYLGFSCGLDFETKLMAKPDATPSRMCSSKSPGLKRPNSSLPGRVPR